MNLTTPLGTPARQRMAVLAASAMLFMLVDTGFNVVGPLWTTGELGMANSGWAYLRASRFTGTLVGKGLVYIRPMFVQPDGNDKQVFVRKILAGYGDRSVIGDSLTSVISQLFPGFNVNLGDRVGGSSSSPTTTIAGSPVTVAPTTGTTPAELLRQAEALFAQADAALAKSPPDFAAYQTKLSQARGLVQQALAAVKG